MRKVICFFLTLWMSVTSATMNQNVAFGALLSMMACAGAMSYCFERADQLEKKGGDGKKHKKIAKIFLGGTVISAIVYAWYHHQDRLERQGLVERILDEREVLSFAGVDVNQARERLSYKSVRSLRETFQKITTLSASFERHRVLRERLNMSIEDNEGLRPDDL